MMFADRLRMIDKRLFSIGKRILSSWVIIEKNIKEGKKIMTRQVDHGLDNCNKECIRKILTSMYERQYHILIFAMASKILSTIKNLDTNLHSYRAKKYKEISGAQK